MGASICGSPCKNKCCRTILPDKINSTLPIIDRERRVLERLKGERIDDVYIIDHGRDGVIAKGSIGTIFKAIHKKDQTLRAVKQIGKAKIAGHHWKDEVELLKTLDHPHICKLYEVWEDENAVYFIIELCRGGDLMSIQSRKGINESTAAILVRQMVSAIDHLHLHNAVHSDLRPENWIFDEPLLQGTSVLTMNLKMIDFGFATKHGRDPSDPRAEQHARAEHQAPLSPKTQDKARKKKKAKLEDFRSTFCKAPEQVDGTPPTSKTDIWSLGIIAYVLLASQSPFGTATGGDKDQLIKRGEWTFAPATRWEHISAEAHAFVTSCLQTNASVRPSACELGVSDWMQMGRAAFDGALETKEKQLVDDSKGKRKLSIVDGPLPSSADVVECFTKMSKMNQLEKLAMSAAAYRLPADKINHLRQLFERMDKNGDGTLSPQELYDGLSASGVSCDKLMQVLKDLDMDHSGKIEYTEFVAATYQFQRTLHDDLVWSVFRGFDADGSGKASRTEIKAALSSKTGQGSWMRTTTEGLDEILDQLDKDGDGEMNFQEFKMLLQQGYER